MNLEQLMETWENDCKIDDNHLGEASTNTPNLHSKYINYLVSYKLKLAKMKAEYNLLRKNKFRYYRGELSKQELEDLGWQQWQGVKPLKNEMDEFLQGDTELVQMEQKVEYLSTIVYFLESIMTQIKSRDFQIKNGITWKQFLVGM
jgi:hypothetical protein